MIANTHYQLGDDQPKGDPWREDRLGFAPFAEQLSKVIANLRVPNGYVIGLHGQWGSGKSTVLNFVNAYLKKHNDGTAIESDKIETIDFRPWIVAGHQDLISVFFKVLSENLGPRDGWWTRRWKQVVRLFRGTSDNLIDLVATIGVTIDHTGGIASRAAGTVAKKSLGGLIDRFLANPSLQSTYEILKIQLAGSSRRFLVTIDDLDRLEDDEVKSIMRMVKTVGRLPNVTYLLAYDRAIVSTALDGAAGRVGPRFAEKIVQQEVELPNPSKNALLTILDEEIGFVTSSSDDSTRWVYIVRDGVHRWIKSPRDVLRLSNALKFSWSALEGEIDPQDLLAMEGVRLFDDVAFNWVRENRDFLFGEGRFQMADDDVKKSIVSDLKERLHDNTRSQVLRVLTVLFPQAGKWLEDRNFFGGETFVDVVKRRGVGSAPGYDAFFGLHPSADAIPKSVVDAVVSNMDNSDEIERVIRSYFGKQNSRGELMVGKLLDELRTRYQGRNPAVPTQALLDAIFRVGEDVLGIDGPNQAFALSPRAQISFLIGDMMEQWGPADAGEQLVKAFQKSLSAVFCADIYVDRGRELGVFDSQSNEKAEITIEDFNRLGEHVIQLIKHSAESGTLANSPFYYNIARSWAHLGDADDAKKWLAHGMLESAEFMAKVGRGLTGHTVGTKTPEYSMRDMPDPQLYDLSLLIEAGKNHIATSNLSSDQRALIAEIVLGSERLASRTPKSPPDSENQSEYV